ncbi:MAG: lipoprotein [Pseudomonadales bacterium]|nr:lipoprotein [Pseudomonadales bacterium]
MSRLIAITLFTVFLAACGQTGPLYLPEKEAAPAATPPSTEDSGTQDEQAAPDADADVDAGAAEAL